MLKPTLAPLRSVLSLAGYWSWRRLDEAHHVLDEGLLYLPGTWNTHPLLQGHRGALHLERSFTVPALLLEQRLLLYIASAAYGMVVFINGQPVFSAEDRDQTMMAPINDLVAPGENTLSIYLSNDPEEAPAGLPGGLLGDVLLATTPWSHIDDLLLHLKADADGCMTLRAEAKLIGEAEDCQWILSQGSREIAYGEGAKAAFSSEAPLSHQQRYDLDCYLSHKDLPIDTLRLSFHLPLPLRGETAYLVAAHANVIAEAPQTRPYLVSGRAEADDWVALLPLLPLRLLVAVDPPWSPDPWPLQGKRLRLHLREVIRRHRRHPEVLAWVVPPGAETDLAALLAIVRELDPACRPLALGSAKVLTLYTLKDETPERLDTLQAFHP